MVEKKEVQYQGTRSFLKHLVADQRMFSDVSNFKLNTDFNPETEFWIFNYSSSANRIAKSYSKKRKNLNYEYKN